MEMMMKFIGGFADKEWHVVPDRLDVYRIAEPLEPMTSVDHDGIEPISERREVH